MADDLRAQITSGQLAAGAPLPAEKALAYTYGVGERTVRHALGVLEGEGLIVRQAGRTAHVRAAEPRRDVRVPRGSRVTVRRPSAAEQREHGLVRGELLIEVDLFGRATVYPSDRVVLTTA